jgi:hypothetical protein
VQGVQSFLSEIDKRGFHCADSLPGTPPSGRTLDLDTEQRLFHCTRRSSSAAGSTAGESAGETGEGAKAAGEDGTPAAAESKSAGASAAAASEERKSEVVAAKGKG